MKISVITPTYNGEKYLAETIRSVLAQTYTDWEYVLIDDGSHDGTLNLLLEYAAGDRRIRVVSQQNAGVAAARNRGIAESDPNSDYLLFLDQDDLLEPEALEVLLRAAEANSAAVAAHGLLRMIDGEGQPILNSPHEQDHRKRLGVQDGKPYAWPPDWPTTFAALTLRNFILTPGIVLIRRAALQQAGLFDPATAPADDWDMWLRLCLLGDMAFVTKVVLAWRQHESNASRRRKELDRKIGYVHRKIIAMAPTIARRRNAVDGYRLAVKDNCRMRREWIRQAWRHEVRSPRQFLWALNLMRYIFCNQLLCQVLSLRGDMLRRNSRDKAV